MSDVASALREITRRNAPAELDLVKAAKCVVALSGWGTPAGAPPDCKAFMSSYFAVEVLRKAIEQHENPVLRLAPEGIEPGRV